MQHNSVDNSLTVSVLEQISATQIMLTLLCGFQTDGLSQQRNHEIITHDHGSQSADEVDVLGITGTSA